MEIDEELLGRQLAAINDTGIYLTRPLDLLVLTGADRVRFLNGQLTCDVKTPAPALVHGYFTTGKGRVESAVIVQIHHEELRLLLPAGRGQPMLERLRKYVIADRVELAMRPTVGFYVIGEPGMELLDPLGIALPKEPWKWVLYELQYQMQTLTRLPNLGIARDIPCVMLVAEDAQLNADTLAQTGMIDAGEAAYRQLRVEAGLAEFATDYGAENFPQEAGDPDAVSYTKGCYLGQEVVARIHYRGGVQRRLGGLRILAERPLPPAPLGLRLGGQEVGKLTSVAPLERGGHVLGLGIVHQKAVSGSTLEVVDAEGQVHGSAELVELPFPEPMPDLPDDAPVN
jgi:folate-binding protein YgfZ